jgi:molybdate transport system regulatory protein
LAKIAEKNDDARKFYKFLQRIAMKVSARNLFKGTISRITMGAVNAEVELSIRGTDTIIAIITNESVESLDLSIGRDAYAIVKATSVIIGKEIDSSKISARNIHYGKIIKINEGVANAEVTLELPFGNTISAIITNESAHEIGLQVGDHAYAIFKASSVIIGVE